jgi:hypothetical protein
MFLLDALAELFVHARLDLAIDLVVDSDFAALHSARFNLLRL